MIGIDLFAGAGGLTRGAIQAGIDVKLAVEIDKNSAASYKKNFSTVNLIDSDISRVLNIDIHPSGEKRVLFGGPPCQGFSTSNQRTRTLLNPQNWLFREFLRIAELWRPEWIVFENVKGITETENGFFMESVTSSLTEIGYTCAVHVLNAVDYGVPQRRSRMFILASHEGIKLSDPPKKIAGKVTVIEAIGDLPVLENGSSNDIMPYTNSSPSEYAKKMRGLLSESSGHLVTQNANYVIERYKHVRPGGNWKDIPEELMANYSDRSRCHTGIYHRLKPDSPSIVIGNYRKNMLIHPLQNRGLSVREAARLQSFPDEHIFHGSIGFKQQQVGNAVPPLLAKAVFEAIVSA